MEQRMHRRFNRRTRLSGGAQALLALLAVSLSGVATATSDLLTVRVAEPVSLIRKGKVTPLKPRQALLAGDVVRVGSRARATLQLGGAGLISVAPLGEVQVFDSQAGNASSPTVGKFKLLAGAMLVDSHSAGNRQLPQDVRLNVGALKTRIYGATVWGASTFEGDTVCLISGAAEIQITDETDHRLDTIGACLRREPSGLLRNLSADSDRILAAAIAATNYSDNPAENTAAAKTVTDAAPLKPLVKPGKPVKAAPSTTIAVVSAEPAEAAAATPIAVAKSANGWTVVVLSLATAAPIEARTQSLQDQGLPAVARSASVQGKPVHRVTIGQFVTQAEALAYAHGTLAKAGLKGWPAPL